MFETYGRAARPAETRSVAVSIREARLTEVRRSARRNQTRRCGDVKIRKRPNGMRLGRGRRRGSLSRQFHDKATLEEPCLQQMGVGLSGLSEGLVTMCGVVMAEVLTLFYGPLTRTFRRCKDDQNGVYDCESSNCELSHPFPLESRKPDTEKQLRPLTKGIGVKSF